jgi:hypothetical protein
MRHFVLGTSLLALASTGAADVSVEVRSGLVNVKATSAPLSEILGQLARQTGMKVVNEGPPSSLILNLSLEGRSQPEAVFSVLEGLGLNYAFVMDPTGSRIETLVMAGTAGTKPGPAAALAPVAPPRYVPERPAPPPAAGPDAQNQAEEEPSEETELPEEDNTPPPPGANTPSTPQPQGQTLQPPSEPLYPSSPFAPRAPMFQPATPEAQPQPQPTPTPPPKPQTNQD